MTRRNLAALLTVVVVAVPGLAIAQDGGNGDQAEPSEVTETPTPDEQTTPEETEPTEAGESDEDAPATLDAPEQQDDEGDDVEGQVVADEDEGHGEAISALARCLPSGRELHGTGWTRGAIVSQAASAGEVTLDDESAMPVATPEDAETVCTRVEELVGEADAPEQARGRPAWAGQDDEDTTEGEDVESLDAEGGDEAPRGTPDRNRGGPPSHANGRGRG